MPRRGALGLRRGSCARPASSHVGLGPCCHSPQGETSSSPLSYSARACSTSLLAPRRVSSSSLSRIAKASASSSSSRGWQPRPTSPPSAPRVPDASCPGCHYPACHCCCCSASRCSSADCQPSPCQLAACAGAAQRPAADWTGAHPAGTADSDAESMSASCSSSSSRSAHALLSHELPAPQPRPRGGLARCVPGACMNACALKKGGGGIWPSGRHARLAARPRHRR